jgi:hypothetical protein
MGGTGEKAHRTLLKRNTHQPMQAGHRPADSNFAKSPNVVAALKLTSSFVNVGPSHEEISVEAEVLWRQEGCPKDRDKEIWLEAERRLLHVARTYRNEQDEKALADPLSRLDLKSDDVMGELGELFPAQTGKEPTSL